MCGRCSAYVSEVPALGGAEDSGVYLDLCPTCSKTFNELLLPKIIGAIETRARENSLAEHNRSCGATSTMGDYETPRVKTGPNSEDGEGESEIVLEKGMRIHLSGSKSGAVVLLVPDKDKGRWMVEDEKPPYKQKWVAVPRLIHAVRYERGEEENPAPVCSENGIEEEEPVEDDLQTRKDYDDIARDMGARMHPGMWSRFRPSSTA